MSRVVSPRKWQESAPPCSWSQAVVSALPFPSSLPATTHLSSAGDLRHKQVGVAALPNAKPSEAEGHCILPVRKLCPLRLSRRKPHSLPEGSVSQLQAFFFHALEVYCHSLNRPPIQLWAWAITSLTSLNENIIDDRLARLMQP